MSTGIPINEELEYGIIGDILSEGNAPRERKFIETYRLEPEHFTNGVLRTAFKTFVDLKNPDGSVCNDQPMIVDAIRSVLCPELLRKAMDNLTVDLVESENRIHKLAVNARNMELLNEHVRLVKKSAESPSALSVTDELMMEVQKHRKNESLTQLVGMKLSAFADPLPEKDNPDALFEGGWLRKGGAAFLTAPSGVGKSVISMQLMYGWALGREVFGIKPIRPLKIAVFQTEDDDQEVAEFRRDMRCGYNWHAKWTDADLRAAEDNITFFKTYGQCGAAFARVISRIQAQEHAADRTPYDLVILNPFQSFTGFDITQNDKLSQFLRQDLDIVIKGGIRGQEWTKCGLFIIHHTTKPPSAREQGGFGVDTFAQYVGLGGSELTNWMRAMLTLMPKRDVPGQYHFVAAKRGGKLHWQMPEAYKSSKPEKILRQSDWSTAVEKIMYWHEVPWDTVVPGGTTASVEADAEVIAGKVREKPISATALRKWAETKHSGLGQARGRPAFEYFQEHYEEYGLETLKSKRGPGVMYGESVELAKLVAANDAGMLDFGS